MLLYPTSHSPAAIVQGTEAPMLGVTYQPYAHNGPLYGRSDGHTPDSSCEYMTSPHRQDLQTGRSVPNVSSTTNASTSIPRRSEGVNPDLRQNCRRQTDLPRPLSSESSQSNESTASSSHSTARAMSEDLATLTEDIPFLRADYSLDAAALAPRDSSASTGDVRAKTIDCLSFEEGDVIMSHWIDPSGWANASLLKTGKRGWVPINYFSSYTNIRAVKLLSAAANFVALPKSFPIHLGHDRDSRGLHEASAIPIDVDGETEYTFSQASINELISGVRALLENSGTLSRSSSLTSRSPRLARCRKQVLTELAYLVSTARKHKRSTDDQVIDKLVRTTLRIVEKAITFLSIYEAEVSLTDRTSALLNVSPTKSPSRLQQLHHEQQQEQEQLFKSLGASNSMSRNSNRMSAGTSSVNSINSIRLSSSGSSSSSSGSSCSSCSSSKVLQTMSMSSSGSSAVTRTAKRNQAGTPVSIMMHRAPPYPQARLDEISKALFDSFNVFIDINAVVESSGASLKILDTTRHCMLACRELLVVVDAVSAATTPNGADLDILKDALFAGIRQLVTAARGFVNSLTTQGGKSDSSAARLTAAARDCMRSLCECASWCREVLATSDIQLPMGRDYPILTGDFFDDGNAPALADSLDHNEDGLMEEVEPIQELSEYDEVENKVKDDEKEQEDHRLVELNSGAGASSKLNSSSSIASSDNADKNARDTEWPGLGSAPDLTHSSSLDHEDTPQTPDAEGDVNDGHGRDHPAKDNLSVEPKQANTAFTPGSEPITPPRDHRDSQHGNRAEHRAKSPHIVHPPKAPALASPRANSKLTPVVGYNTPFVGTETVLSSDTDRALAAIHPHLYVRNDKVRAGTVPALMCWLLSPLANEFDRVTFLLVFHIFTSATVVADAISDSLRHGSFDKDGCVQFILLWLESFWHYEDGVVFKQLDCISKHLNSVELNERLRERKQAAESSQLIKRPLDLSGSTPGDDQASSKLDTSRRSSSMGLRGQPTRRVSHEDLRGAANAWSIAISRLSNSNMTFAGQKLLEYDANDVAARLFDIDNSIMTKVEAEELLEKHYSASKRALGLAPNVVNLVMFSNRLSAFVGDTILADANTNNKTRRNILRAWIRIADCCFHNGDLNATVSIVSTLRSTSISRLRRAFDLLSPKKITLLEKLGKLTTPGRNFAEYRRELRARAGQVCIPYMGLYLADLTLLEEGCSKERKVNGVTMINFDRYRRTAEIIRSFQNFQVKLPKHQATRTDSPLCLWLKSEMEHSHKAAKDDDHTYRRSLLIEPPA